VPVATDQSEPIVHPRTREIPVTVLVIAALAILIRLVIALVTHFTSEDFMITLRYAENLANGNGMVYNVGERVLGTTTPLYTIFLAGVAKCGLPPIVVGKIVNVLADGALCIVVYRWLRSVGHEEAGKVAAFFLAVNPILLRWSISGMETSLVTLCGTWVWYEYSRRRVLSAFVWLGILFLLRWDSVLLLGVLAAAVVWRDRRLPLSGLLIYGAIILPWLILAWRYYGNPIPVTGHAKMVVYGWRYRDRALPELMHLLFRFAGTPVYMAVSLCAVAGLWRVAQARTAWLVAPLAWFALYWVAFLVSKVLLFEWYIPPTLPVYAVLFSMGAVGTWRWLSRAWQQRVRRLALSASAAGVVVYVTWLMVGVSRETQQIEDNLRIPLGLWLQAHAASDDTIMLEPVGFIGYYAHRKILDPIGLVTPEVLPYYRDETPSPWLDIVDHFKPRWCVLRPGELEHIRFGAKQQGHDWESRYQLVQTFSYTPRRGRDLVTFHVFVRR
jgi:hypothetical protein